MKIIKEEKINNPRSFIFSLLIAICSLLIISCSDPLDIQDSPSAVPPAPPGYGYLTMTDVAARSANIQPTLPDVGEIEHLRLSFTDLDTDTETLTTDVPYADRNNPILLPVGEYSLAVIAFSDDDKLVPFLNGTVDYIEISQSANTPVSVDLFVYKPSDTDGTGTGTFKWDITWSTTHTITQADLILTDVTKTFDPPLLEIDLLDPDLLSGTHVLPTGTSYRVLLILKRDGYNPIPTPMSLHIYKNLISLFEFTIDNATFSNGVNEPDGSSTNPFLIYNEADLRAVGRDVDNTNPAYDGWTLSVSYKLMADIELTGYWIPRGFPYIGDFTGTFDGNGKVIKNMEIDVDYLTNIQNVAANEGYHGMFKVNRGTIKNLGLENITITGTDYVGGITGSNYGTIENCYVKGGKITGTGTTGEIGGIVGSNNLSGSVLNCYAAVDVEGRVDVGGIVGYNSNGIISNCVALNEQIINSTTTGTGFGRICGYTAINTTNISNNYARSDMIVDDLKINETNHESKNGEDINLWNPTWFRSTPGPGWTNPPWTNDRLPTGVVTGSTTTVLVDNGSTTNSYLTLTAAFGAVSNSSTSGTYTFYLLANQTFTATYQSTIYLNPVTINIVGVSEEKTITLSGFNPSLFVITGSNTTITIGNNITLKSENNTSRALVRVINGGHFQMLAGSKITGHSNTTSSGGADDSGGGVSVEGATFTMLGGEISGNESANRGGGVIIQSGGTFNMHDGVIKNNRASLTGGGVAVVDGEFNMHGGTIGADTLAEGNVTLQNGGGVIVSPGASFNMHSGEIVGNTANGDNDATGCGGGVQLFGTLIMKNGKINNNYANNAGGGIGVASAPTLTPPVHGSFTMEGGEISYNKAVIAGGGVYVWADFSMLGGIIKGNTVENGSGGGVFLDVNVISFSKTGGIINGNNASPQTDRNTASVNGHAVWWNRTSLNANWRNTTLNTNNNISTNNTGSGSNWNQ